MTSSDFLYSILAACAVILTVFISFALYHLIIILKRVRGACDIIEDHADRFFHLFDDIREKICGFKNTIDMIATTVKAALAFSERVGRKSSKRKKSENEKSG